jgi:hypothetical protein
MPDEVIEGANQSESSGVDQEVLHEAESQGWVPKDRYRGNEKDWVDAETFVKRGREILPILKKHNENLVKDLQYTKDQLKEFRETAEEFKKYQREAYERKAADYEKQIKEIKDSRAQAISDGDGTKVNALDDALDEAKDNLNEAKQAAKDVTSSKPEPENKPSEAIDPNLQVWLDRNKWFGTDRRMTGIVNGIGESLRMEYPSLKGQPFLDKLDEVLEEEFPGKFGSGKTKRSSGNGSPVESGSGRQGRGGGSRQSYDNLPADAKAACDRFVRQKITTREEYVQNYAWD